MKLSIINGPNLNLLGKREPTIYGSTTFEAFLEQISKRYPDVEFDFFQSNVEGEIINHIHLVGFTYDGIIINAGAYTHTSVAIADAISAVKAEAIEVHISNTFKREEFRHISYLSPVVRGVIAGFGLDSYRLAIESFLRKE